MFDNIEKIKLTDITGGPASVSREYVNRPNNGFIYRCGGASTYFFSDSVLTLRHGEFLFIPQGENYRVKKESEDGGRYIAFNFSGEIPVRPFLFRFCSAADLKTFPRMWLMGGAPEKYRCLSVFYDILSSVASNAEESESGKAEKIAPASEYLEKHLFEHDLDVTKLPRLCGVSGVTFRKLFLSVYGMTPKKYIIDKRLTHARSILESGDYDYVYSVAYEVGYEDPLYFSREYKKKYGISPSAP